MVNSDAGNEKLWLCSALFEVESSWILECLSEPSLHCPTGEDEFCLGGFGLFFCYIEVLELCSGISK